MISSTCMLEASADAFVQRGDATTNYGSASQVVVKNAPTSSITGNSAMASRESTKLAAPALEFARVVLKRSADLSDGFPVMIGTPFYATDPPATLSDAAPPPGRAFYRIEPSR